MAPDEPGRLPAAAPPAPAGVRRLWQVPAFVIGLLVLLAVWISRPWWNDPRSRQLEHALDTARAALEDRAGPLSAALTLLNQEQAQLDRYPRRAGEFYFLLGSLDLCQADRQADRAGEWCRQALAHLQQAERLGVAEEDRDRLFYRLGKALYRTGGDPQQVTAYLSRCVESMPADQVIESRFEGYGMLTQAYLKQNNRSAALQANERQLQLPIVDNEPLLAPVRLLRGELLWEADRVEARKVLARIKPGAPPAVLERAQFLLALGFQQDQAWSEAAGRWEKILADYRPSSIPGPQILFYLGWCYRHLERSKEAVQKWEQLLKTKGEEAQAAALRLAELRLDQGSRAQALALDERALAGISRPEDYHNQLVPLEQAQALLLSGGQACLQAGAFGEALQFTDLYGKIGNREKVLLLRAEALEAWALAEGQRAVPPGDRAAEQGRDQAARMHRREAAAAYQSAADLAADQSIRADRLWSAGKDYLQGQDFASARQVLERYLELAPASEHASEAYYRLGEAYQALRNVAAAGNAYRACISRELPEPIPKSQPFTFRARYQLALLVLAEGKRADAEEMLRQNLELMRHGPDPEAEEKSLFTLAELVFEDRTYSIARLHLEQALRQYPAYADRHVARFRLGECYRHLAEAELQNLRNNVLLDMRLHSRKRNREYLERAVANYDKVRNDLVEAQRAGLPLSPAELEVLEWARIAMAQCLFNIGDYRSAIPLYHDLAGRYHGTVEGLLALEQQWLCYQTLADRQQAVETLTSLRLALDAMDDRAFAGQPPHRSRKAFADWIKSSAAETQKLFP